LVVAPLVILDVVGFRGAVAEWMDEDTPAPRGALGLAAAVEQLDLATVVETSQALSGELVLERLIETLLVSAVELAGVDRGLLIFVQGNELRVEAEATMAGERSSEARLAETSAQRSASVKLPRSVWSSQSARATGQRRNVPRPITRTFPSKGASRSTKMGARFSSRFLAGFLLPPS